MALVAKRITATRTWGIYDGTSRVATWLPVVVLPDPPDTFTIYTDEDLEKDYDAGFQAGRLAV